MLFIEEAFSEQPFYQLFKGKLECADTCRLHGFNVKLVFALGSVDIDVAGGYYGCAVFRCEFDFCEGSRAVSSFSEK